MKKSIAVLVCLAFVISVNAQDREIKDYKLIAPAVTAETQFGPFTYFGAPTEFDVSMKFRYFINESFALRLRLGLGTRVAKTANFQQIAGRDEEFYQKVSDMRGCVALGGEYHFKGTKRLSPYLGLEAGITFGSNRTHGWNSMNDDYNKTKTPWIGCKVALATGVDIYILENFYCGLELGISYDFRKDRAQYLENRVAGQTTTIDVKDFVATSDFAFGVAPTIRLGWKF